MSVPKNFRRDQWKMLVVTMFCYLFFYTGRHNFGWAAKDMAADLEISYALVGWISSAMLLGYATGQLINGNLASMKRIVFCNQTMAVFEQTGSFLWHTRQGV